MPKTFFICILIESQAHLNHHPLGDQSHYSVLCSVLGIQCFSKERSTVSKILFQIAAIHSAIIDAGSPLLDVSFKVDS